MTTARGAVDRRRRGQIGEEAAVAVLQQAGYAVLERNVRCGRVELDVVARDGDGFAFVEVKARWGEAFGAPEEAITPTKRRNLIRAAERYLRDHGLEGQPWRIDVLALRLAGQRLLSYELFRDAVEDE